MADKTWGLLKSARYFFALGFAFVGFVGAAWWLRHFHYEADPTLYGYLEIVGSVLALTFAANGLVRFRGKNDRVALILAIGFVIAGFAETIFGISFYHQLASGSLFALSIPLEWMISRTFLAALLLVALLIEHRLPQSRHQRRELVGALAIVLAVLYLSSLFHWGASYLNVELQPVLPADSLVRRPGHLFPAGLFLLAAVGYRKRLRTAHSAFDHTLYVAAGLNSLSHIMASQAEHFVDAPFALAQILRVTSYAVVLGGALIDNVKLFEQVRQMAASDPLTGLANYRRFLDVLEGEMQRSQRTRRPFAVLLLDLDGLKKINDKFGHVVGSRAICRVAEVLRSQCRAIDTAARYGGDEFALILPETDADAAASVVLRIREHLAADLEEPPLSASIGVAMYPRHGKDLEALLSTADRVLYAMKRRHRSRAAKKTSKGVAA